MGGYLDAIETDVDAVAGIPTELDAWRLLGGDVVENCHIDVFDLVTVTLQYDVAPYPGSYADINGSGIVDIFDVVMVGVNLGKDCDDPPVVVSCMAKAQSAVPVSLRIMPSHQQVDVDELLTVTVEVENVSDLYGADLRLAFAAETLEAVQVIPGEFPDSSQAEWTQETVDNDQGEVVYAIGLQQPSPPSSGSGVVCSIGFRAKAEGMGMIQISSATLVDSNADPIVISRSDGWIRVGPEELIYLPAITKPDSR
jgi:hypothetical protein